MEALLKDLLVEAGGVEAHCHGALDVSLEVGVGGSGPDALGIEALVKHHAEVEGLIVEEVAVTLDVNLAHAGVIPDRRGRGSRATTS